MVRIEKTIRVSSFFIVAKEVICIKIRLKILGIRPALFFSHVFDGIVWNMQFSDKAGVLVVEVRNSESKQTSFAALELFSNNLLWENVVFDEPWWINLAAVSGDLIFLTHYTEAANPDQKKSACL